MSDELTREVFAAGMALLAERWNREISPGLSRIYATALRDLGGDLFVVGITRAIEEDEFFPSPKRIRTLAVPTAPADVRGAELFASICTMGHHTPHGSYFDLDEIETVHGEAARRAIVAVGGSQRLRTLTEDATPFVLRDFAKAFAAFDLELSDRSTVARRLESGRSSPVIAPAGMTAKRIRSTRPTQIGETVAAVLPGHAQGEG